MLFKDHRLYAVEAVHRMVSEMNGHARGLHYLRKILDTSFKIDGMEPNHGQLFQALSVELRSSVLDLPPQVVAKCLLGRTISILEKTSSAPGALPYSYYFEQVRCLLLCTILCSSR